MPEENQPDEKITIGSKIVATIKANPRKIITIVTLIASLFVSQQGQDTLTTISNALLGLIGSQ